MAGIKKIIFRGHAILASLYVIAQVTFAWGADKPSYNADIVTSPQTYSYKYDGNRISSLTGSLVDFGARMYDPHTGRWTTQDPTAWKYLGLSPYNYCGNNPVNLVDPDGAVIETLWDIVNVAADVENLISNIKQHKIGASIADGAGLVLDVAAVLLPGVPAGVGAELKIARKGENYSRGY